MLWVKTAVSLDVLADELIKDLRNIWKKPFEAPVVIFADNKIEQWFKLRWLEKEPVLANLTTKRLDNFLLEILAEGNKTIKILSSEILRNLIIAYLISKNSTEKYNYEINPGVKRYLEDDGLLNELRLFDFATEMANLFKEYEITRPSDYEYPDNCKESFDGFIKTWKKENSFFKEFDNNSTDNENWQYKLYYEIFLKENSLMEQVNNKVYSYQDEPLSFYTLPQFYEKKRDYVSNKIELKFNSNLPIYIFGLSGIGQFYRVMLQKLAENNEIYIFIQSPVDNLNNDSLNNELLKNWGKIGIENINLWLNEKKDNITCLHRNSVGVENTLLSCIKDSVANNKNSINTDIKEDIPSISVTTAPSKIREIENLHSHICKLLNSTTDTSKPTRLSDILVVAPNIEEYKTAILEVFAQSRTKAEEERDSRDKTVVSLPYNFVDASAIESLTAQALDTLFLIREKGVLSRPEFFSLVRNPVIQIVRNINNEEIKNWERWITDMNVYRDRTNSDNKKFGWLEAVKRLLLARFSLEAIVDGNDEYLPYANIDSSDNDSLCRFIDCVESLENWINTEKWLKKWENKDITKNALDNIMEFLNSWLFMKEPPKDLTSEAIVFRHIKAARESLKFYFASGCSSISWKITHLAFLAAAQNADYNSNSIFINGVTFMKFAPNRSIPIKYLFMLGAGALALPGRNKDNALDLRDYCPPWKGDVSIPDKNRFAFLSQMMNTSEGFYISYVNKDLQKDEDFYPSTLITDIKNFLKNSNCSKTMSELEIALDETRSWEELFTNREIRNKITQQNFDGNAKDFDADKNGVEPIKIPAMVRFFSLKQFLQDPFEFQANRILGIEDTEEDPEKTEFEPIVAEFLNKLKLERMLIALKLKIQPESKIKTEEELKKKAVERGWMPDGVFCEKEWKEIEKNVEPFVQTIEEQFPKSKFKFYKKKITADIFNDFLKISWKLLGEFLIVAENDYEIHFINVFKSKTDKKRNYLTGYIAALALLGSESEFKKNIFVDAFWIGKDDCIGHGDIKIQILSPEVKELLNKIYLKAYYDQYAKVLPIDLFNSEDLSYSSFINSFADSDYNYNNPWNYFPASKIFNIIDVCGFCEADFKQKWIEERDKQCELMKNLWCDSTSTEEVK